MRELGVITICVPKYDGILVFIPNVLAEPNRQDRYLKNRTMIQTFMYYYCKGVIQGTFEKDIFDFFRIFDFSIFFHVNFRFFFLSKTGLGNL